MKLNEAQRENNWKGMNRPLWLKDNIKWCTMGVIGVSKRVMGELNRKKYFKKH